MGIGALNDVPVPGDYDGDGKTDLAVWRPGDGKWYVIKSSDGLIAATAWGSGALNDVPVPGDYDGDGKTDLAVWRPGDGKWYVVRSSDGAGTSTAWGSNTLNDIPIRGPEPVAAADIRDYFPLRMGDYYIKESGEASIVLRTERITGISLPLTMVRGFNPGRLAPWDDLFAYDPADGKLKLFGSYGGFPRALYLFEPPLVVGSNSMRPGTTFSNPGQMMRNTNDNSTWPMTFSIRFAGYESVSTPAGNFPKCIKMVVDDGGDVFTFSAARGIGVVTEGQLGVPSAVALLSVDGTDYGTPPPLAVSDVHGIYDLDVNIDTVGTRWEKNVYNLVHNLADNTISIQGFRPDGSQAPRSGSLSGAAFGISGPFGAHTTTAQGAFTPDGLHFVGRYSLSGTPTAGMAVAGTLISALAAARSEGDEEIYQTPTGYLRNVYHGPLIYNGFTNVFRQDHYDTLDPGATPSGFTYQVVTDNGFYNIGDSWYGPWPSPVLNFPHRTVLGEIYADYVWWDGHRQTASIDQVGSATSPFGQFPLSLRVHVVDNNAGTLTHNYLRVSSGLPTYFRRDQDTYYEKLVWLKAAGNTFGDKPTTTPPSIIRVPTSANVLLRDGADGTKSYYFDAQIQNPDGTTATDPSRISNVKVYAWPSMSEIPLSGPWTLFHQSTTMHYDGDGNGPNDPGLLPWSEIEGYLDVPAGTLSPGFYKCVITDNAGQVHTSWLFHDPPTEVGKVDFASMAMTPNGDGSVTLSWTNPPSPPLDPAKHQTRVYVRTAADLSGDGIEDVLLQANLPPTENTYTIPAAQVARLKSYTGLDWYVQFREVRNYTTNPDGSSKNSYTYRNYGQSKTLSLP